MTCSKHAQMVNPRTAIIGATGAVGSIVCRQLETGGFPMQSIRLFGSAKKSDRSVLFRGTSIPVETLCREAIYDIDLAIVCTPDEVAIECATWVVEQGGIVVDESAAHRMHDDVPLVVPEINGKQVHNHHGIIASPNCSTIQLAVCLKPIHDLAEIRRVVVSTYQSASGAGEGARRELLESTAAQLAGSPFKNQHFELPLAMNVLPKIGSMHENGFTSEENKMIAETRKIFGIPDLKICVTCVRVPVEFCHSESVAVETRNPIDAKRVREAFAHTPGIKIMDEPNDLCMPTPLGCHDFDDVFVGRIRRDFSVENGVVFWCVSDNLRKGAATNAVQIARLLVEEGCETVAR